MKTKDIRLRVSREEYESIRKKAEKIGLTISAFLRMLALKSDVVVQIDNKYPTK